MPARLKTACVLCLALMIAGCKEALYSNLSQVEANQMVAVLASADIGASREINKDGVYTVLVDAADVAQATVVLRQANLPVQKYQSLGDVFSASSIIGTPFEQHARYIYAMNEEMSRTIAEIDGVTKARVTVNAPLEDRNSRQEPRATASVTVHYKADFDTAGNIAKFKQILSHSIPNLSYEDVSVVFFPSSELDVEDQRAEDEGASNQVNKSQTVFLGTGNSSSELLWFGSLAVLALLTLAWLRIGFRLLLARSKQKRPVPGHSSTSRVK